MSGPCQNDIEVCGQEVFVIRDLHKALIGLSAIEALGLVHRVSNIASDIPAKFPELFEALGSLPGEYRICLSDNAKLFAITTPRRVALSLLPKVRTKLERMEKIRAGLGSSTLVLVVKYT